MFLHTYLLTYLLDRWPDSRSVDQIRTYGLRGCSDNTELRVLVSGSNDAAKNADSIGCVHVTDDRKWATDQSEPPTSTSEVPQPVGRWRELSHLEGGQSHGAASKVSEYVQWDGSEQHRTVGHRFRYSDRIRYPDTEPEPDGDRVTPLPEVRHKKQGLSGSLEDRWSEYTPHSSAISRDEIQIIAGTRSSWQCLGHGGKSDRKRGGLHERAVVERERSVENNIRPRSTPRPVFWTSAMNDGTSDDSN